MWTRMLLRVIVDSKATEGFPRDPGENPHNMPSRREMFSYLLRKWGISKAKPTSAKNISKFDFASMNRQASM